MLDELVNFAKPNHPGLAEVSGQGLKKFFEKYSKTTLISFGQNFEITGIGVYQDWPEFLNFICIVGSGTREENLKFLLKVRNNLPKKPVAYFDEEKMEAKIICRR